MNAVQIFMKGVRIALCSRGFTALIDLQSNTSQKMFPFSPFKKRNQIRIRIKLLAGLDKIADYDPQKGLDLDVKEGTRLKKALKLVALPHDQPISYIVNGEKADSNLKLKNGDEIFCFLPFAGG
jgi:hypothetical protein